MLYDVSFVCMCDIVMLCLLCVYFCVNAAYSFIIFHLSVFFCVHSFTETDELYLVSFF